MKTLITNTISTTIVNEPPLLRAPPAAAPAPRAPPTAVPREEILWASTKTWGSIENWPLNTMDRNGWIHPVGSVQYNNLRDGQVLSFKVKGEFNSDCKVVVVSKLPLEEYDLLKKTKTVGPFSAEAYFPWNEYKETKTCLICVKRV